MLVHSATTPVRPATNLPAPDRKASTSFREHVRSKTKADGSGHSVTSSSPASGASSSSNPGASASASSSSANAGATSPDDSSIQSSLDASEDQNMQFLELQSQVSDQSETFTTLSNVMKTENDTLKNTSANMAI